jgi:hypothetical protein
MCVTSSPALITDTLTYTHATLNHDGELRHVNGYQNQAENFQGPNCMFLNYAGTNLETVRGPEHTKTMMADITAGLPDLRRVLRSRGSDMFDMEPERGFTVEDYGDYTVILAQGPGDISGALELVPIKRRPIWTDNLRHMIDFYMSWYAHDSFVLACFDGTVKPKHPITVSYKPRNPEVLTAPGLDGHDGRVPTIGAPVHRDFHVAFGVQDIDLRHPVHYDDPIQRQAPWAPRSVSGFHDNRGTGPNGDYVVPISALLDGLTGTDLAAKLITERQ